MRGIGVLAALLPGVAAGFAAAPQLAARRPLRGGGALASLVAQGENWDWGLASAASLKRKGRPLRCIVTGGSSGVGEAICRELGKRGAKVFVTGRRDDALRRTAAAVEEEGGFGTFGVGDVAVEADVKRLYQEAETFFAAGVTIDSFGSDQWVEGEAGVDVLVTSAGIGRFGNIEDLSHEDFSSSFDTNVKGTWLWAREVLPAMKRQRKGQVVFISSVAGLRTYARCSVYGATKWAVQGIAGSLREECKGSSVKIATLCPGSVASPWWMERERGGKEEPATPEMLDKMLSVNDCAAACMSIIDQAKSCDIESIVLQPPAPVIA